MSREPWPSSDCGDGLSVLRVHSKDLHDHLLQEVADCFDSETFADMIIRCGSVGNADQGGDVDEIKVHKVVLAAVSPYLRMLFECHEGEDSILCIDLPDVSPDDVRRLLSVIYNGFVEATLEELRRLIFFARDLCILIPVSKQLLNSLNIELPETPAPATPVPSNERPSPPPLKIKNVATINGQSLTSGPVGPPPLKRLNQDPLPHSVFQPAGSSPPPLENCIKTAPNSFTCSLCNSTYTNETSFRQHMKFHQDEKNREHRNVILNNMVSMCYDPAASVYTCEFCRSTYSHPGNFKQHLGKHERETGCVSAAYNSGYLGPPDMEANAVARNLSHAHRQQQQHPFRSRALAPPADAGVRPAMPTAFTAATALPGQANSNTHLSNALRSAIADKVFSGDYSPTTPIYHCEICGRDFKHPGNYKQHMSSHMRTVTAAGPTSLAPPPQSVPNPLLVKKEPAESALPGLRIKAGPSKSSNGGSTTYKCEICDVVFESQVSLYSHKQSRHAPTPLQSHLSTLTVMTGNGDLVAANLYPCDEPNCFESFSKEGWLAKHKEKTHGIVSALKVGLSCPVCLKTFDRRKKLTRHMSVHNLPEKHYRHECDICGKKFTRPHHVRRHKLLHTGERPFECTKCDMSFYREDKLKEHQLKNCGALAASSAVAAGGGMTEQESMDVLDGDDDDAEDDSDSEKSDSDRSPITADVEISEGIEDMKQEPIGISGDEEEMTEHAQEVQ